MRRILLLVWLELLFSLAFMADAAEHTPGRISGFSEARLNGEIVKYFNQKNHDFLEKYIYEAKLGIDLSLLKFGRSLHVLCRGELNAGLGESPFGLALHPFDINYAVNPSVEYRFSRAFISCGIDHRCFHYIDQRPPLPIVYWNRMFIEINSPDRRATRHARMLLSDTAGGMKMMDRWSWSGAWGYYISEFFGIIRPINLMSLSRPHYLHQFDGSVRYAVFLWKKGRVELTERMTIGFKRDGRCYWMQETGVETLFLKRDFDAALVMRHTLDGGRFDSKDQLFEVGVRVDK